jgi:hypothetical protein
MHYDYIELPASGEAITANPDHTLNVPDRPIIPFIEGGRPPNPMDAGFCRAEGNRDLWR